MQQTTEAVDQCLLEVKRSGNNLSCITNLLVYLTRLTTSMTFDDLAKVHSALTPVMNINETQVTNGNLTVLTSLQNKIFHLGLGRDHGCSANILAPDFVGQDRQGESGSYADHA